MELAHNIETSARVPVGERSLIQRLNRRLAKDSQKLFMSRSRAAEAELCKFYIADTASGEITASLIDLEGFGRVLRRPVSFRGCEWLRTRELGQSD